MPNMSKESIFINFSKKNIEMDLVKAFLDVLRYCNEPILAEYLSWWTYVDGSKVIDGRKLKTLRSNSKKIVYKQEVTKDSGRIDAKISLSDKWVIYLECKCIGNKLTEKQAEKYAKELVKEGAENKVFLIIAEDVEDNIKSVLEKYWKDFEFIYGTWGDTRGFLQDIKDELSQSKKKGTQKSVDIFLLEHFLLYLQETGEAIRQFTGEQAEILENYDPKSKDAENIKGAIRSFFNVIKAELRKNGFDKISLRDLQSQKEDSYPSLCYTPSKIMKDKRYDFVYRLNLTSPNDSGKNIPAWDFGFVENTPPRFFRKILDDSAEFKKKIRNLEQLGLMVNVIDKYEKGVYHLSEGIPVDKFDPEEHIKEFNNGKKIGFWLHTYREDASIYKTEDIFYTTVDLFKELKFIIDDYL